MIYGILTDAPAVALEMRMQTIRTLLIRFLLCALICGCRRKDASVAIVQTTNAQAPETDPQSVDLRPLSQLTADQPTHVACDSLGNVYWVQETPAGKDTLFVAGQDDIPQPTQLTTNAIIAIFGPPPPPAARPGSVAAATGTGSGNIQSIAIDNNDNVLFFFTGGIGRSMRVCLGRFNPHDQSIDILANTQALAAASRMGTSIGLAQGQIIQPRTPTSNQPMRYWLRLHHSDAAIFLRFDPRATEAGQSMELSRAFEQLSGDQSPQNLSSDLLAFSAGSDQGLLMLDWHEANLWRVDQNGLATKWMTVMGLPRGMSMPVARPGDVAIAFAPPGERATGIAEDAQSFAGVHTLHVQYPAFLAFAPDQVFPIAGMDNMHAPAGLNLAKLNLATFVPTNARGTWIGYDTNSGVLMRVEFSPRN